MIKNGLVGDWRLSDSEFTASFHLPHAGDKVEALQKANPFPSDEQIHFDEESHTYEVNGVSVPLSVTGLIHRYARVFDPSAAIQNMRAETRQSYSDRGLVTEEDILRKWDENGKVQRNRGTLMHFHIEQYLNSCVIERPYSPEFEQFLALHEQVIQDHQIPFRTELSVFSKSLNVCGQIDAIFKRLDDTFALWDWKRSKLLRYDSRSQMKEPLDHLPDVNIWHYFLQLNIYRRILQEDYGLSVSAMYLGVFHPSRSQPLCVRVPLMDDEMHLLFSVSCSAFVMSKGVCSCCGSKSTTHGEIHTPCSQASKVH